MDNSWLEEYVEYEEKYGCFYKEENSVCKVKLIFLNSDDEIMCSKSTSMPVVDNKIKSDDLFRMLEKKRVLYNERYMIKKIVAFNFDLDTEEIVTQQLTAPHECLREISDLDDIEINPTIQLFQDMNEVLVFLKKRKCKTIRGKTRKRVKKRHNKTEKL